MICSSASKVIVYTAVCISNEIRHCSFSRMTPTSDTKYRVVVPCLFAFFWYQLLCFLRFFVKVAYTPWKLNSSPLNKGYHPKRKVVFQVSQTSQGELLNFEGSCPYIRCGPLPVTVANQGLWGFPTKNVRKFKRSLLLGGGHTQPILYIVYIWRLTSNFPNRQAESGAFFFGFSQEPPVEGGPAGGELPASAGCQVCDPWDPWPSFRPGRS